MCKYFSNVVQEPLDGIGRAAGRTGGRGPRAAARTGFRVRLTLVSLTRTSWLPSIAVPSTGRECAPGTNVSTGLTHGPVGHEGIERRGEMTGYEYCPSIRRINPLTYV